MWSEQIIHVTIIHGFQPAHVGNRVRIILVASVRNTNKLLQERDIIGSCNSEVPEQDSFSSCWIQGFQVSSLS